MPTDAKITQRTETTTPVNADLLAIVTDVATVPVTKKITLTSIKAFLKTYFDTLYLAIVSPGASGNVLRSNGSNWTSAAISSADVSDITYGNYSPTLTGVTNCTAAVLQAMNYTKIGNVITVSGNLAVDATGAGNIEVGISLPVPSNFTAVGHCTGTGVNVQSEPGYVQADVTNDRAALKANITNTANNTWQVIFMYRIL